MDFEAWSLRNDGVSLDSPRAATRRKVTGSPISWSSLSSDESSSDDESSWSASAEEEPILDLRQLPSLSYTEKIATRLARASVAPPSPIRFSRYDEDDEEADFFAQERWARKRPPPALPPPVAAQTPTVIQIDASTSCQTRTADVGVQVGSPANMLTDTWISVYWRAKVLPSIKSYSRDYEDWVEWTDLVEDL